MLRYGAYAILDNDEDTVKKFEYVLLLAIHVHCAHSCVSICAIFRESDIDHILQASSTKVTYGGSGQGGASDKPSVRGMNLSKATFKAEGSGKDLDLKDPSFWEKVLGPKPAQRLLTALSEKRLEGGSAAYVEKYVSGKCT